MKVKVLGGVSIGRSCMYVESSQGTGVLLDAGINVRFVNEANLLPEIPPEIRKRVKAIFITHAHLDHLGAVVHAWHLCGRPPVYASEVTVKLASLMLNDASVVHARRSGERLLEESEIEECVANMTPIAPHVTVPVEGGLEVTAYSAGHIVGALYYRVTEGQESMVYSGDISLTKQMTVGPAELSDETSDLVVVESTYGLFELPSRRTEEVRFVNQIRTHIEAGRRVLIPSFALGRAQEVILILRQAIESGELRSVRIYVDGMVRAICDLLEEMRHVAITGRGRKFAEKGDVFYNDDVLPVITQEEREAIITGPPAVIVASPGMLTGGASGWYAARMINDPNAVIMLVGYSDEETPARLIKGGEIHLDDGSRMRPACVVEEYKLSAHASCSNLISFVKRFDPIRAVVVHGSREAREALAEKLGGIAVLPQPGEEVDLSSHLFSVVKSRRMEKVAHAPLGLPEGGTLVPPPSAPELLSLAARVDEMERIMTSLAERVKELEVAVSNSESMIKTVLDVVRELRVKEKVAAEGAVEEAITVGRPARETRGEAARETADKSVAALGERVGYRTVPAPFKFAVFRVNVPNGVNEDSVVKRCEVLLNKLYEKAKEAAVKTNEGKELISIVKTILRDYEQGVAIKRIAQKLGVAREVVTYAIKRIENLPAELQPEVRRIDNVIDAYVVVRVGRHKRFVEELWKSVLSQEFVVEVVMPDLRSGIAFFEFLLHPHGQNRGKK